MIHFDSKQSLAIFNQMFYENAMANNCKQCFNAHYQPHCHPTTNSLWLCSSVHCGPPHQSRRIWLSKPTTKNSSTAYIILYKWIDTWFLDSNRRVGVWSLLHGAGTSSPSHWQQVEEQAPKPVGWTMCFLLMTLVPVQKLCVNIYVYVYMYVHSLYEFCYRSYIQRESHSVLAKLHPITFYRIISGECAVPGLNATFCFLWFTNCVLLFDKGLILGCLWPLVFVLNNILILGIWCSTIPHLPWCFCPWTFCENIGFNTVLANPFMSHLAT